MVLAAVVTIVVAVAIGVFINLVVSRTKKPHRNMAVFSVVFGALFIVLAIGSLFLDNDLILWVFSPLLLGIFFIVAGVRQLRSS